MADLIIRKGSTKRLVTRWEHPVVRYVPITGVSSAAPVVITAEGHDMPDGWRFAVSGIKGGGSALNAGHAPPREKDYFKGKVLGEDTIEINGVNGAAWAAYVSGGVLQFNLPVDFTDATAKLQIRELDNDSSPVLLELTDEAGIEIDVDGTATITFDADDTAELTVESAYFDMEITLSGGDVLAYPKTRIVFESEITRD